MSGEVPEAIRLALRRRGITLRPEDGGTDDLLITTLPAAQQDRMYAEMQRYSFRLVLRDVLRLGSEGPLEPGMLTRHASLGAVLEHLAAMQELSLVRPLPGPDGRFELLAQASTLGPTLEWLVAEIFARELGFCVAWSLPLRGGTTGGDLDVVALAEGLLLVVEVKSGPPRHLNRSHVGAFLDRVQALAPHGAIFFEDTELRMADKVVVLFEEELAARGLAVRPRRLHRELFTVGPRVFIANAHPDVAGNLARCVCELFRWPGVQLDVDLPRVKS
jgi:hypothetical protein